MDEFSFIVFLCTCSIAYFTIDLSKNLKNIVCLIKDKNKEVEKYIYSSLRVLACVFCIEPVIRLRNSNNAIITTSLIFSIISVIAVIGWYCILRFLKKILKM